MNKDEASQSGLVRTSSSFRGGLRTTENDLGSPISPLQLESVGKIRMANPFDLPINTISSSPSPSSSSASSNSCGRSCCSSTGLIKTQGVQTYNSPHRDSYHSYKCVPPDDEYPRTPVLTSQYSHHSLISHFSSVAAAATAEVHLMAI